MNKQLNITGIDCLVNVYTYVSADNIVARLHRMRETNTMFSYADIIMMQSFLCLQLRVYARALSPKDVLDLVTQPTPGP